MDLPPSSKFDSCVLLDHPPPTGARPPLPPQDPPPASPSALPELIAGWVLGGRRHHRWWLALASARGLNGIALAWATPAIYSMVADTADAANRGLAFAWLRVAGNSGGIIGSGAAIMLADTAPAGIPGWRVAFLLTAADCFVLAAAVYAFVEDPHFPAGQPSKEISGSGQGSLDHRDHLQPPGVGWRQVLDEMLADTRTVMGIPTVQVVVAQGMVGSFPGAAFSFRTMWLELIGSRKRGSGSPLPTGTATLQIIYQTATSVGALSGGLLGNIAARRLPNAGRIECAQFSSGSAAIFSVVLLYGLPTDAPWPLLYAATLIPMGLLASWNGSATNNPIKAEIVPQKLQSSVYARTGVPASIICAIICGYNC
eukprot:SM000049S16793  [mRNA]  locus=s49:773062:774739:- [translate_table: standard]